MNTVQISGRVQDSIGGAIAGASVVAEQAGTNQKFTVVTNAAGEYLFAQLPIGTFSLAVTATDFKQTRLSRLEVHAGDRVRRDFTMEIGEHSEVVTVQIETSSLPTDSAEIRDVINHQQVVDLPVKGRQFLDLAMLSPGVVRPPGGTRGDALQQAGTLVNVLGQRSGHNLYLLDGVAITDEHFNNMVIAPSMDAVEEFNIEKTSYAPEFGGKSGAVINVVTRSGTNDLHGSLFEFVRNDVFDARNFFDSATAPIPPFRQNQFGGAAGGPARRNKTFFFLSYEGQRVRKSLTQTFSVPTRAMRAGDLSGLPFVFDPNSGSSARFPFPGNRIPRIDPVAAAMLVRIPLPNRPGLAQNLLSTGNQMVNTNQYGIRLDHQFTQNDSGYLRASLFDARESDPFGSSVLQETLLPGFGRNLSTHAINGAAGWTHTFGPNLVNEFRAGALTVVGGQTSPNRGNVFAAQTGLQGVTSNPSDLGYPQISFGGQFTTMGDPALFTFRNNHDAELSDNLIWHRTKHTVKLGGYFMHFNLQPVNPNGARGIFSFTPRWTSSAPGLADGNAFADFLLGDPTTAQVGLGRGAMNAATNWGHFYVQDSWQTASNIKIDFGVRYEYNRNMTDSDNGIAAIDTSVPGGRFVVASDRSGGIPPAASLLQLIPIPYVASSAAGWNRSLLAQGSLRIAPRAGLVWRIPELKSVIRIGAGIYPNQAAYSIVTNLAQNLPFFVTKTVTSSAATPTPSFTTENALTGNAIGTVGGNNLDHNFRTEYNEVWNLNVERELSPNTVISFAYIGSRTVHADSATVLNVPSPGPGAIAARRPIPQLSQISDIRWNGWATYHALTVGANRRFSRGLMFDANWTWSHSIDDASDPGATLNETNLPQNVYDLGKEKASSSFDHRQRAVLSFVYRFPMNTAASVWMQRLFGDWQVCGNFTVQSGAPFTVNIASDQANIGAGPAQRPNVSGNPNDGPKTPEQWFDTSLFSLPALYSFGNASRNGLIGPGLAEFDLSAQKGFRLTETTRLQFRAEAYNLFNRPNFNIPNRTAFTGNFGTVSSAQDSRQLQFALKFLF
jgi:hypothetical protein